MNVRTRVRILTVASLVALIVATSPMGTALAAPKRTPAQQCSAAGGVWDSKVGECATRTCSGGGKHGDIIVRRSFGELNVKSITYRCNGFFGTWERV